MQYCKKFEHLSVYLVSVCSAVICYYTTYVLYSNTGDRQHRLPLQQRLYTVHALLDHL